MEKQDLLYQNMTAFYRGDPARIQHFVKVHSFAAYIGRQEGLSDALQAVLEAAALVHDIGILPAEEKYGSCDGKLQEQEGVTEGLILSMRGVPVIDLSGIQGMIDLVKELEGHGTEVYLTSVQPKVLEEMRKGGLIDLIGEEYIFDSAEEAIIVAQKEHM